MIKYFLCILGFLLINSCEGQEDGYTNLTINREDGSKIIKSWHRDSANISTVKEYYETGELNLEYSEIDDYKNGLVKKYYKSGNKKYEGEFSTDTIDGQVKMYYDNRKNSLKAHFNYENGQMKGNQKKYYENGKVERYYSVINNGKATVLSIDKKPNGDIVKMEGSFKTFGFLDKVKYEMGDTLYYDVNVATPKEFKINYEYCLGLVNDEDVWKKKIIEKSDLRIEKILTKSGDYILKEKLSVYNLKKDTILYENYEFHFSVD